MGGSRHSATNFPVGIVQHRAPCAVTSIPILCGVVLCLVTATTSHAQVPNLRTIAYSGMSVDSGDAPDRFLSFVNPSLNNRGEVAFTARVNGDATSTNNAGLWIFSSGGLHAIARDGVQAAGYSDGSVFHDLAGLNIGTPLDDDGRVAFASIVRVTGSPGSSGLWMGTAGQLTLIAKQGDAAPGATGDAVFNGLTGSRPTLNSSGTVAFRAPLTAPYDFKSAGADGIWRVAAGGALEPIALVFENAAGVGDEARFVGFRSLRVPLNRAGVVGVQGDYNLTGGTEVEGVGLWAESGAGLELHAWESMPAPQFGPSAIASVAAIGGIDATDSIAFNGYWRDSTDILTNGRFIGTVGVNGLKVIASTGALAPGAGEGHVFSVNSFVSEPSINSAGRVAFYGEEFDGVNFNTTRRRGVWAGAADAIELVAQEGDVAANTGMHLGAFGGAAPAINRFGQVAFANTLVSALSAPSASLWATDLDGELALVARAGDSIEVAPSEFRTIQSLSMLTFHGDDDGKPRGLNDMGQIAFLANFVGGTSGVFVSNVVAHLPGDYNSDGAVDAADYTVWRDGVGSQHLAADGTRDGIVGDEDYALWKEFFGRTLGAGAGSVAGIGTPVPEPDLSALILTLGAVCCLAGCRT
jgi:hypothetical protein